MGVYPFQYIPDNLDLSKKTALEIRDYFGREKTHHLTELHEKPNLKPNQYSIFVLAYWQLTRAFDFGMKTMSGQWVLSNSQ